MTHSLFAEENQRRGEPEARRRVAEYPTYEAALAAAKARLDDDVRDLWREGLTPDDLVRQWTLFGEDAFVVPGDPAAPFSGADYVRSRAAALAAEAEEEEDDEIEETPLSPEAAAKRAQAARLLQLFAKVIGVMISLGFAVGGVTLLQYSARAWADHEGGAGWLQGEGVVIRAGVLAYDVAMGSPEQRNLNPKTYLARVLYKLEVNGKTHEVFSTAPGQSPESATRQRAEGIAARYHPNDRIPVYYRPDDVTNARLSPIPTASFAWVAATVVGGVLFVALGLYVVWYMLFRFDRATRLANPPASVE